MEEYLCLLGGPADGCRVYCSDGLWPTSIFLPTSLVGFPLRLWAPVWSDDFPAQYDLFSDGCFRFQGFTPRSTSGHPIPPP
jgi:hypothetical protein